MNSRLDRVVTRQAEEIERLNANLSIACKWLDELRNEKQDLAKQLASALRREAVLADGLSEWIIDRDRQLGWSNRRGDSCYIARLLENAGWRHVEGRLVRK